MWFVLLEYYQFTVYMVYACSFWKLPRASYQSIYLIKVHNWILFLIIPCVTYSVVLLLIHLFLFAFLHYNQITVAYILFAWSLFISWSFNKTYVSSWCGMVFSYIPSSARRRSGSARYFSVWHYWIAEKHHNSDADSLLWSMFMFSRPITVLLIDALAVQGHGQETWPSFQHDASICSFIG